MKPKDLNRNKPTEEEKIMIPTFVMNLQLNPVSTPSVTVIMMRIMKN